VSPAPILSAAMFLTPMLVMRTLWMELQTGTSIFMPLLFIFVFKFNQLTIVSNSFHGCKIIVFSNLFSIRVYLSLTAHCRLFIVTNTYLSLPTHDLCVDVISDQHKISYRLVYYTTIFSKFGQNRGFPRCKPLGWRYLWSA